MPKPPVQAALTALILALLLVPTQGMGMNRCGEFLTESPNTRMSNTLTYSQSSIRKLSAGQKMNELLELHQQWLTENPGGSIQGFILWYTAQKPIVIVRDVNGRDMLVDKHTAIYNYTQLMGVGQIFKVHIRIQKDYISINPATGRPWTKQEMMRDLVENGFIDVVNGRPPTYEDLLKIPRNILDFKADPLGDLVSSIFKRLEVELKGSDFLPQIQNQLKRELENIDHPAIKEGRFTTSDVIQIKNELLQSKELLEFLIERINPNLAPERHQEVTDFLVSQLQKLEN